MAYELVAISPVSRGRNKCSPKLVFSIFEYGPVYASMIYMNNLSVLNGTPHLDEDEVRDMARNSKIGVSRDICRSWAISSLPAMLSTSLPPVDTQMVEVDRVNKVIRLKLLDGMYSLVSAGDPVSNGSITILPTAVEIGTVNDPNIINPYVISNKKFAEFLLFLSSCGGFRVE